MAKDEAPQDLYVAAFDDADAAEAAWQAVKQLAADEVIEVEALALLTRDSDGKIHVKETTHETGAGAAIGALGGALVGLIFPPSLLATAVLGAGLGAGAGAVLDRVSKHRIKENVDWTLPPTSSGVVVVFDERWVAEVEKALAGASKISRDHLHDDADKDLTMVERMETMSVAPPSDL